MGNGYVFDCCTCATNSSCHPGAANYNDKVDEHYCCPGAANYPGAATCPSSSSSSSESSDFWHDASPAFLLLGVLIVIIAVGLLIRRRFQMRATTTESTPVRSIHRSMSGVALVAVDLSAPSDAAAAPGRTDLETASQSTATTAALDRYVRVDALRALLTPDSEGGVPVRLVRARHLLQSDGKPFTYRQALERDAPDAFADSAMVERLLAEVAAAATLPATPPYPGLVCMSHSWLDVSHPDPQGRNLREIWLPAIEWYYCERLARLGTEDAADFGLFVDALSMCQKDAKSGLRTLEETRLFKCALSSLDVLYAHQGGTTFLSTRLPSGCAYDEAEAARATAAYEQALASGAAAADDWSDAAFVAKCAATKYRPYACRGWTNFEKCVSSLIKPSGQRVDIGIFARELEKAKARAVQQAAGYTGFAWAATPFRQKRVAQLRMQALGDELLARLVRGTHEAPLSPAAFDVQLQTWTFTNGADVSVVSGLYQKTAEAVLGCTPSLAFRGLKWSADEWAHLGTALRLCANLDALSLVAMPTLSATRALAALGGGLALPRLAELDLSGCRALTALPPLDGFPALTTLNLRGCVALRALPPLGGLSALAHVDVSWCLLLRGLPDEAALRQRGVQISRDHWRTLAVGGAAVGLPLAVLSLVLALGGPEVRAQVGGIAGMGAAVLIFATVRRAWAIRDMQRAVAEYQGVKVTLCLSLRAALYPVFLVCAGVAAIFTLVFGAGVVVGASSGLTFEEHGRALFLFSCVISLFFSIMMFYCIALARHGRAEVVVAPE